MDNLAPVTPLHAFSFNCAILSYAQWLAIPEPPFYAPKTLTENSETPVKARDRSQAKQDYWNIVTQITPLQACLARVTLLRVDAQTVYKWDGKSRKEAWEKGKLQKPATLVAFMVDLTLDDYTRLCLAMQKAQESGLPHQLVKAAYRDLALDFKSERLAHGLIYEALNIALRGRPRSIQDKRQTKETQDIHIHKALVVFEQELAFLDRLEPKNDIFITGVLAGVLIMLGLNYQIEPFLIQLNQANGERNQEGYGDPVESLLRIIALYRQQQFNMQPRKNVELCQITLNAIISWNAGRDSPRYWRKQTLTGIDHMKYIHELKRLKDISAERDL